MDTNMDKASLEGATLNSRRAEHHDDAPTRFAMLRNPLPGEAVPRIRRAMEMIDPADDYAENIPAADPMSPMRGVALGVVICVPVWIALFYAILR